jgi:3-deoxy-D-manno-octulosonate 8-phosphate phosphatase KdsC-like HAD superfamily phosphatase
MNKIIITDFDGIFTSPGFIYTKDGKIGKLFSPNDGGIYHLLLDNLEYFGLSDVIILTGEDKYEGLEVTEKRLSDLGLLNKLNFSPGKEKYNWIKSRYKMNDVIYFGDDIYDINIFSECFYSCTPLHSPLILKRNSSYSSGYKGGEDAFTDMITHVTEEILNKSITEIINKQKKYDTES